MRDLTPTCTEYFESAECIRTYGGGTYSGPPSWIDCVQDSISAWIMMRSVAPDESTSALYILGRTFKFSHDCQNLLIQESKYRPKFTPGYSIEITWSFVVLGEFFFLYFNPKLLFNDGSNIIISLDVTAVTFQTTPIIVVTIHNFFPFHLLLLHIHI